MILYNLKILDAALTGTSPWYSPASLNADIGRAGRWFCTVRASQGSGTTPKISVDLEHSGDNVNWLTFASLLANENFSTSATTMLSQFDRGTTGGPVGPFQRLKVTLSAASGTPGGNFTIWLCGRDDL